MQGPLSESEDRHSGRGRTEFSKAAQHIAASAKQSGVFMYASGRTADCLEGGSGQDRQKLKMLEERLEEALQRRPGTAGGSQVAAASLEEGGGRRGGVLVEGAGRGGGVGF